jgi:hypothetical protein
MRDKQARSINATRAPQSINEEARSVEFIVSGPEPDRHGTVVNMDNWRLDAFRDNPIIGYQHKVYGEEIEADPDNVIGTADVRIETDSSGRKQLVARISFEDPAVTGNELAGKIFQKIKAGTLRATSVGFMPLEINGSLGRMGEDGLFYFHGQELIEISVVNIPSYAGATARTADPEIRDSFTDYPDAVSNNASRALQIKEDVPEQSECGTRVGWTRARQLSNREPVSEDTLARMASFKRFERFENEDPRASCGALMWLAWGGRAGVEYAERKLQELDSNRNGLTRAEPDELDVGDFVEWDSSGGTARGEITQIERDGTIDVPGADFSVTGTPEDPAALITVMRENEEGLFEPTGAEAAHLFSTLTKIDPLPKAPEEPEEDELEKSKKIERARLRAARYTV